MAYNNYYPMTYQPIGYNTPYYTQNTPISADLTQAQANTQPMQGNAQNAIIWVQGEAGAKAYPVAPNNTVQLWDSEAQIIYLKSADVSGMPTMKVLDYTIRESHAGNNALQKSVDLSGYVTREEFEKRIAELGKGVDHE